VLGDAEDEEDEEEEDEGDPGMPKPDDDMPVSLDHLEASTDNATLPLSALERAAHEETLATLCDLFPDWNKEELEAVLSANQGDLQATSEEMLRLADLKAMSGTNVVAEPDAPISSAQQQPTAPRLDMRRQINRMQLDAYERQVINTMGPQDGAHSEMMTIALTVPPNALPGQHLKVRMVDGSQYSVPVPPGAGPGSRFLAQFPVAAMQRAARELLEAPRDASQEEDELQQAMAASKLEEARQKRLEDEEAAMLEAALKASAAEAGLTS